MYNPNDFDIELNFTNIGTTIDANWVSDVYAWRDYLTAANNPVKIIIPPLMVRVSMPLLWSNHAVMIFHNCLNKKETLI